jgi:hypothetical protein
MTRRAPAACWALMGKLPGDKDDYRVLIGDSAPGELAGRVWAGVPSTPQLGSAPGPGKLPWATFMPYGAAGQQRLAVTAIDATQDRDAVGRPTVQVRYVEIPFTEVARNQTGYRALYQAVPEISEMAVVEKDETLGLDLGAADPAGPRALADAACFGRAAGLAALMLCGDVLITVSEQDPPSLPDRLAEFDRILALLPFGLRAGIALASWYDGTQATPFRIAFGKFASHGQVIAAHGEPVPPPADERAAGYLRALITARERFGVAPLVEHLGRHRAPIGPDDGREAVEILTSLGNPGLVVEAVRSGSPSAERVANARRYAEEQLDQASLDELETYLLTRGGDAEREVHAGWSDRSALLAARIALGQLAADRTREARRLYAYAAEHGAVDSFLAAAAEGRTREGEAVPPWTVARLVREFARPERGDLPVLRQAVLGQPELARWLLRLSLRRDPDPRTWLGWLDPSAAGAPDWLCRYVVLATPPGIPVPMPAGAVAGDSGADGNSRADGDSRAAGDSAEDLALIASFVLRKSSPARLADPWWPLLLSLARSQPDDPAARSHIDLIDLAKAAREPSPDLPVAVRLDTLRLYLELAPRHYPLTAGAPSCRRYLDALWELWSEPPADDDLATLAGRLLKTLLRAGDPLSEAAVTLLLAVVTDSRIPLSEPVADAIAGVLATTPALVEDPRLPAEWWMRLEGLRPQLRTPPARLRAAVRREDADPVEIAVLCGQAAASGLNPEDLTAIAGAWLASRTTAQANAMFRILDGVLNLAGIDQGRSYDEYLLALSRQLAIPPDKPSATFRRGRSSR